MGPQVGPAAFEWLLVRGHAVLGEHVLNQFAHQDV